MIGRETFTNSKTRWSGYDDQSRTHVAQYRFSAADHRTGWL
jgi:hypothetical protein